MNRLFQIVKSFFALPIWVISWISLFLIPANFAGFWFIGTTTGFWVALLGAGAIIINLGIIWVNRGFSRALAFPHVLLWVPLQIILIKAIPALNAASMEHTLCMAVLTINGISLLFDVTDCWRWWKGDRAITGFPDQKPRF